jgi:hypothetical protein
MHCGWLIESEEVSVVVLWHVNLGKVVMILRIHCLIQIMVMESLKS